MIPQADYEPFQRIRCKKQMRRGRTPVLTPVLSERWYVCSVWGQLPHGFVDVCHTNPVLQYLHTTTREKRTRADAFPTIESATESHVTAPKVIVAQRLRQCFFVRDGRIRSSTSRLNWTRIPEEFVTISQIPSHFAMCRRRIRGRS